MLGLAIFVIGTFLILLGGIAVAKITDQTMRDKNRKAYRLAFPSDLDPDRVTAWLRTLSGTLRVSAGSRMFQGLPTVVLEVWATNQGITHWLKVPWAYEPMIRPKLEALIPGVRMIAVEEHPVRVWVHAVEAGLKASSRQLHIHDSSDLSTNILSNFGTLSDDETLMMQWVISPAVSEHKPIHKQAQTNQFSLSSIFRGIEATKDEVEDRRGKLDEANMLCVLRVGGVASTPVRAQYMVRAVMASLDSARGPSTRFFKRLTTKAGLQEHIDRATAPMQFPAQLSVPELAAVIGWPLGNPMVPGLPAGVARYIPTPAVVPTNGRVLGKSNYPGRERTVAQPYSETVKHTHIIGGTGAGKSTLMANMAKQDIDNDFGLVLIESKGDLFQKVMDYVPARRINDVIVLDLTDKSFPVGFNLLQQGDPSVVATELIGVFDRLFSDTSRSLWMHELMTYAIPTLMLDQDSTIMDLPALVSPNSDERVWRDEIIRKVKDPFARAYWKRSDGQYQSRQDQKADPLLTRFHPLSDPVIRNIIGQSKSSFYMDDVVKQNKILLVNLSGVDKTAASVMGTLLMNSLWNSVQRWHSQKGIQLYLDEFHRFMNIPVDTESMLVEARSMGLGMVLAHQQLAQLKDESLKQAIMTNARTKLLFDLSAKDARVMADEFGGGVAATDISNLGAYEMVARVMTQEGVSAPFTLNTLEAARPYGKANQVRYVSRQQFGRPVEQVQDDMLGRRNVKDTRQPKPPPKAEGWGSLG